ncbi:MAG: helix-turn-helix domain-containing protein [Pirellulaceae bacterium]
MKNNQSARATTESYLVELADKLTVAVANLREQCDRLRLELDEQRDFIRSMKENARDPDRMLTLREAAKIAGVSYETMIAWANWKEIEAVDVARKKGGKPRWRIAPTELQRFLKSRARFRYEPPPRRRRTSRSDQAAKFYF